MKIRLNKRIFKRNFKIFITLVILICVVCGGFYAAPWIKDTVSKISQKMEFSHSLEDDGKLDGYDAGCKELLLSYFDAYYKALAELKTSDLTGLFDTSELDSYVNAKLNQAGLDYLIEKRKSAQGDLSYRYFKYTIYIAEVKQADAGVLEITFTENHAVRFALMEGVTSYTTGLEHVVAVKKTDGGYKILSHTGAGFYTMAEAYHSESVEVKDRLSCDNVIADILAGLIEKLKDDTYYESLKRQDYHANKSKYTYDVSADNAYDRDAAVEYAMKWVSADGIIRNPDYEVFDGLGGNCNNYISQCIYAGGIPMDYRGSVQWKYYSGEVNGAQTAKGRSTSWTGVGFFYTYCKSNQGYGMVARVDCEMISAQAGDVLQIRAFDEWDHSVIITKIIMDEDGNPIDIVINSNTTDRINYPISAYEHNGARLIKIFGWNNS